MKKLIETLSEDFVTRFARELYHCSSCNYCVDAVWPGRGMRGVCATMEEHSRAPGYSGRGFIEAARALVEGQALNTEALAQRVFTCTTCGNCEAACPIGLHPASVGRALREELIAADALPSALVQARDAFFGTAMFMACHAGSATLGARSYRPRLLGVALCYLPDALLRLYCPMKHARAMHC